MRHLIAAFTWSLIGASLILTAACIWLTMERVAHAEARQCGRASWYKAGRVTAEGRPFRPDRVSVAHRSYRLGTMLSIVDQATGRAIVARVSDRGPYKAGRIVDLSRGAARLIGMLGRGIARVCVSPIARAP